MHQQKGVAQALLLTENVLPHSCARPQREPRGGVRGKSLDGERPVHYIFTVQSERNVEARKEHTVMARSKSKQNRRRMKLQQKRKARKKRAKALREAPQQPESA